MQIITSGREFIIRAAVMRWIGDGLAAALPVLMRLLFALLAVKLIATYGSEGALTNWGIAQNTVTLLAALMGFSVQSGVAARVANGLDPSAFGRGLQLLFMGILLALLVAPVTSYLDDLGFDLPIISLVAVLSAACAGVGSLVSTYLPATGRVHTLTSFYIAIGVITCGLLMVTDKQDVDSLTLAIGVGWFGGALVFFASSRRYRHPSFWLVQWDSKQARKLLGYGLASFANATVQISAALLIRDAVMDAAGLQNSDLFESSLRLTTLVEGIIGSVAGIMLWRRVANNNANLATVVMAIFSLAFASLLLLYFVFRVQGETLITILFAEQFAVISEYNNEIFLLALLKIAYAVLIIPIFLNGRIKTLITIEIAFATVVWMQIASLELTSSPVANALNTLIYANSMSVGLTLCCLVCGAGRQISKAKATQFTN